MARPKSRLPEIDTILKYAGEKFYVKVNFGGVLQSGDALTSASCNVYAYDFSGENVTSTLIETDSKSVSGAELSARIIAGTTGKNYKLKFVAVTDDGDQFEYWIKLIVISFPR